MYKVNASVIYSSDGILEGIRNHNKEVLQFIYNNCYPLIKNIIIKHFYGSEDQAKDVFQDALLTIYTGVTTDPPLKIQHNFIAFLTTVCKRRMIDEMRKNKNEIHDLEIDWMEDSDDTINDLIVREEKARLFEKHFYRIGERCRKLLSLFFEGHSIKEITCMLKMSSERFTKLRRFQCKVLLFKSIYKDSKLKELIDGKPWTIREIPRW